MAADPAPSDRSRGGRPPWPTLAAAAIVVPTALAGLTLLWPRSPIETELTHDATAALSAAGVDGATVRFAGRDAAISGVSGDAGIQAVRVVQGVTGVRIAQLAPGGLAGPPALPGPAAGPAPAGAAATTATAQATPTATSAAAAVGTSAAPSGTAVPAPAPSPAGGDLDAAAKQALQGKLTALLGANPITFGPDSPRLTGRGRSALTAALGVVRGVPGARLELDGYVAPGPGNGELTAGQLSDQRAAAVRDAMVAAGVPADHLAARGRGEDTAPSPRDRARRVDITVV